MYTLANDQLSISILDPIADQGRFGTRYCTGGYIFQIDDAHKGALLSGPSYPDGFDWFGGQGLPEAFHNTPLYDKSASPDGAIVIGIGLCDMQTNKVLEFCRWDVQHTASELCMRTTQSLGAYSLELVRTVTLHGRTVRSHNHLVNKGACQIDLRWYPHPFLPLPTGPELIRLNVPVSFPENRGFEMASSGYVALKNPWPPEGHFLSLEHQAHTNLVVIQKHPRTGLMAATCSFVPTFFPIWGNKNCFSWEPFFEHTMSPGRETTWWIDYEF
jgi:hypothetical protein